MNEYFTFTSILKELFKHLKFSLCRLVDKPVLPLRVQKPNFLPKGRSITPPPPLTPSPGAV